MWESRRPGGRWMMTLIIRDAGFFAAVFAAAFAAGAFVSGAFSVTAVLVLVSDIVKTSSGAKNLCKRKPRWDHSAAGLVGCLLVAGLSQGAAHDLLDVGGLGYDRTLHGLVAALATLAQRVRITRGGIDHRRMHCELTLEGDTAPRVRSLDNHVIQVDV